MKLSEQNLQKIVYTCLALKFTYGLVFTVAGADKFLNLITQWVAYLNPWVISIVKIEPTHFMWFVGILEIILGIMALSAWPKIAGYAIGIWLLLIAGSLFLMNNYFDIAIRDIVMAVGAFTLAQLSEVLDEIVKENKFLQN